MRIVQQRVKQFEGKGIRAIHPHLNEQAPDFWRKIVGQKRISAYESILAFENGFERFGQMQMPSELTGMSFFRAAGTVISIQDEGSRQEVGRMLERIEFGGAFLVVGHGGKYKCGGVAAGQGHHSGADLSKEHEFVRHIASQIDPEVVSQESGLAELTNAMAQAQKVLNDSEFGASIRQKNISIIAAVATHNRLHFIAVNRPIWKEGDILRKHPLLYALKRKVERGHKTMEIEQKPATHYAHAIIVYDPLDMRTVLDPQREKLSVGGLTCVDARQQIRTPDGPAYLFRLHGNEAFAATVGIVGNEVSLSWDDTGSIIYALGHVDGVNSLAHHGEKGNGHIMALATTPERAMLIRTALMNIEPIQNATNNGETLSTASFNGQALEISRFDGDMLWQTLRSELNPHQQVLPPRS
ncbi:MAG: hypothetical protein ABII22_00170 [Candidatus Micrarchaeota archaeon]